MPGGSRHRVDVEVLTAELRALWQPFIASDAPLLIAFDVRPFFYAPPTGLVVRDYQINDARDVAKSEPLTRFQERMEVPELLETRDYADFGAVHAAFALGRLLSCTRRDVGLKHSSSLDWQDIWNSNLVFIGKPRVNAIIRSCLEGKEFVEDDGGVIHNLRPRPGEAAEYRGVTTHGMGDKYGVITRVRGPQSGRHMLLLNGPAAELMWALAECVTNPEHVAELMAHVSGPSPASGLALLFLRPIAIVKRATAIVKDVSWLGRICVVASLVAERFRFVC